MDRRLFRIVALAFAAGSAGCGQSGGTAGEPPADASGDGPRQDATDSLDAETGASDATMQATDATATSMLDASDAEPGMDAGSVLDATDSSASDTSTPDAGTADASIEDASTVDAAGSDGAPGDGSGGVDASAADAAGDAAVDGGHGGGAGDGGDAGDGGATVVSLAAGGDHTCALWSDGTVRCWGLNGNGQLGDGFQSSSAYPVAVKGLSGPAIAIGAGAFHSCAVIAGGQVECWGNGASGLLGNGTTGSNALTPVAVSTITNAVAVTGGYDFSCALLSDGTVMCWGFNQAGEVGAGASDSPSSFDTPQPVSNVRHAVALGAGYEHACVATTDTPNVACWGNNSYGQLGPAGPGFGSSTATPVRLTVAGAVSVTGGFDFSCALTSGNAVECWGAGPGNSSDGGSGAVVTVPGMAGATQISGNPEGYSVCAVIAGGDVTCWNGGTASSQPVAGLSGARQVASGRIHTCALLAGTNVMCWGDDHQGQLGDGMPATQSATPVAVAW
jgi:Regulator of chromosome condensation (RCC1) repeat